MIEWIDANKSWLFDGAGVVLISAIVGLIFRCRKQKESATQTISAGDNSTNLQGGRDVISKGSRNHD